MPSAFNRSMSRSRARCDVMPCPRASGTCRENKLMRADSCGVAQFERQRIHPAADFLQRLIAREIDVDRRDRYVAFAHGVEIGAGTVVFGGAGRSDPVHRTSARIALRNAWRGTVPFAESRHRKTANFGPRAIRHI